MLGEIWKVYLETRKEKEQWWAKYATRPFAAAVLYLIRDTAITPNQVTLIAFLTSLVGAGVMVGWTTHVGLIVAVLIYQLAYIFDCVDGMLARYRKIASKIGHLLDFLLDEFKAIFLMAAVSARLYFVHDDPIYPVVGVFGVALVAVGLSLTTFTRRPEYPQPPAPPPSADPPPPPSLVKRIVSIPITLLRYAINYPVYIVFLAIFDVIEAFFWIFVSVYALYVARTFLQVALKLGRFTPPTEPSPAPEA